MEGKKKLLITLGCSLTEGVGCYDKNLIPDDCNSTNGVFLSKYKHIYNQNEKSIRDRFHEYSWPSVLGKKLNFDKVINLGLGGASSSGNFKVFMDKYEDENFEEWDVLLIWFLQEPSRISMYANGRVHNRIPSLKSKNERSNKFLWEKGYVQKLRDLIIDPLLEQLFYVKCMNEVCQNRGWKFISAHADSFFNNYVKSISKKDYWLLGEFMNYNQNEITSYPENCSLVDNHPNENGYKIVADNIYNALISKFPYLINNKTDVVTEIEYNGDGVVYDLESIHAEVDRINKEFI